MEKHALYRYSVKLEKKEQLSHPGAWCGRFIVKSLDDGSSHSLIANFAGEYAQLSQRLQATPVVVETPDSPSTLNEQSLQNVVRRALSLIRGIVA